ncbi:MAG TPA: SGNH hydrolase domain-containing protein [Acidimicrobiales bacterium]
MTVRTNAQRPRHSRAALLALAIVTLASVATASYASGAVASQPLVLLAQAVADGEQNIPLPATTTPTVEFALRDHVNLGRCSAFHRLRSAICNYGDPNGTKTVVVFGNSHSAMWVPALAVAAKADHWKFYPVVKESCGYDTYTDVVPGLDPRNACSSWYDWAKTVIARLHPNVLVLGSYTKTTYWALGERTAIAQLRPLTKRFILLSDSPWIPAPSGCFLYMNATQGTCLRHEAPLRIAAQVKTHAIAEAMHVQYLDITPLLCDARQCPSVIDGIIPTADGSHVTPQYSAFVALALDQGINLTGSNTVAIVSVPVPAPSSSTSTVPSTVPVQ